MKSLVALPLLVVIFQTVGCQPSPQSTSEFDARKELVVAISPDIPPYVLDGATTGLEVELMQLALSQYELSFVQLPYGELETAVPNNKADVSVGVREANGGEFDSIDFIGFSNVAIAKKTADAKIEKVADLGGHPMLTWQKADQELGDKFQAMFGPGGPNRANYQEIADQRQQVEEFWKSDDAVIVIDENIFNHFSQDLGHSLTDMQVFKIFPDVTNFKVAFANESLCAEFNDRIHELCQTGQYAKLLKKYAVELPATPCD
ncbi:substrate-binding periplasmic protein [Blastopirellula retiformator]|uniref:Extracellular solute-binding protein n=1 Tax=Blastopirellula retiformator TaxID=2527970 RepID=A0A5C5UT98_9BACT|nr:transporter substrate-binding domain-containing protein [Blastopirellula retiformator]TWT29426.1 Extracellular solute-binding protein [Blastopirellula retiformator]